MAKVRKTVYIDDELLAQARDTLGTNKCSETVNKALQEIVRRAAMKRLGAWDLGGLTIKDLETMREPSRWSKELTGE